jgi:hypothetical protein
MCDHCVKIGQRDFFVIAFAGHTELALSGTGHHGFNVDCNVVIGLVQLRAASLGRADALQYPKEVL